MKKSRIAAQLYTIREFTKTPADIAAAMKKIKSIGFDAVQVSGMGPIGMTELRKILEGEGLFCCATHAKAIEIVEETQKVIDDLKELNCRHTAFPSPYKLPESYEEAAELGRVLNVAAEKMAGAGLGLSYHNHAREFEKFNGELMLDVIYAHAPKIMAEIDTFWIQAGGGNPVDWITRFAGREPLLHLKDFGIIKNERTMFPIGYGNLDWKKIIPAAEAAGVEYYIIEQDVCLKDPFESLRDSLNFLVENFVS